MHNTIPYLTGVQALTAAYDAFIVDLWGVVYEEDRLCYGVFNTLSQLKEQGKEVVFLSNTPRRNAAAAKKLERMGVKRHLYTGLLTAGEVMYHEMLSRTDPFFAKLGKKCFHLGPDEYWADYATLDYKRVETIDDANFIFATGTFGSQDSMDKYDPFFRIWLSRRLPLICACPDPFIMQNGRILVGAGALAAQYQKVGGNIFWKGKPDAGVFNYCLEGLKTQDKSRVAVIGDSMATDIVGANYAGLDAIFVAGGVHAKDLGIRRGEEPSGARLTTLLHQYDCAVKAVLPAFIW